MTIKQMAEKHKVSPQAIYQRLKKQNVTVESLTDKETGELTPSGEMIIDKLFVKAEQPNKPNSRAYSKEKEKQIKDLHKLNAELNERIKALEAEVLNLKADKEFLSKALEKEQDLHRETVNRLLHAAGQTVPDDRLTWRERLTGRRRR